MHPIEHFCCQDLACPDYYYCVRGRSNLSFRGWSEQGKHIRMVYCRTCGARFSERKGTVLEHGHLSLAKVVSVLAHLRHGCGTRSASRLADVDKNTVTRYLRLAGAHAARLHDELVAFSPGDPRGPA